MKILTLVYSIGPGGTERAAVNYAIAYKKAGCDSRVWVLGEGHDRKGKLDAEQVISYIDKLHNHEDHAEEIARWKPDIIHIHAFGSELVNIIKPLKLNGAKVVETNVFSRPRYSEEYRLVDISFQLAYWGLWKYEKWMRNEEIKPYNLRLPYLMNEEDFGNVLSLGDKKSLRTRLDIPEDAFIAARVGQAHPSKWDRKIFEVVKAAIDANKNIYFVFVGLPEVLKKDMELLADIYQKNIRTIDFIKGDKALTDFYSSIDVFVHISAIGESFGYVLTEAMICGCPVITLCTPFKDNAQYEVVENLVGGYCVNRVDAFTKRLLLLAKGGGSFDKDKLRTHVISRFSATILIKPLLDVYNLLVSGNDTALKNLSDKEFSIAEIIIKEQAKSYGWKSFIIKAMLQVMHLPILLKLKMKVKS